MNIYAFHERKTFDEFNRKRNLIFVQWMPCSIVHRKQKLFDSSCNIFSQNSNFTTQPIRLGQTSKLTLYPTKPGKVECVAVAHRNDKDYLVEQYLEITDIEVSQSLIKMQMN